MKKMSNSFIVISATQIRDPKTNSMRHVVPGEILEGLPESDAADLFMNKRIDPMNMPDELLCKAKGPGSYKTADGILTGFNTGDMIFVSKDVALDLMRRMHIFAVDPLLARIVNM